jgi:hypothetical protein
MSRSFASSLSPVLRSTVAVAALLLAAASAAVPQGYSQSDAPGITVIKAEQAQAASLTGRPFEMPFARGENGTALMVRFLREARAQGASYLSDIEIHIVGNEDGAAKDCVTRVVPADHGSSQARTVVDPGHYETHSVMKPVTHTVTEFEYRCRMVSKPYTHTETSYEYSYDYASHSSRSRPVSRTVTDYRMEQECHSEPVTRTVTRYEYQMESEFVPAQWHTELRWVSDWDLDESAPVCSPLTEPRADGGRPNLLRAIIYAAKS